MPPNALRVELECSSSGGAAHKKPARGFAERASKFVAAPNPIITFSYEDLPIACDNRGSLVSGSPL